MQSRIPEYQEAMSSHEIQRTFKFVPDPHSYLSSKEGVNINTKAHQQYHSSCGTTIKFTFPKTKPSPLKKKKKKGMQEKQFDSEYKKP